MSLLSVSSLRLFSLVRQQQRRLLLHNTGRLRFHCVPKQLLLLTAATTTTTTTTTSTNSTTTVPTTTILSTSQKMSFHFASKDYTKCFDNIPTPNIPKLKQSAIDYLDTFDEQSWYDDPIVSLLNGKELRGGHMVDTVDALGEINGHQVYATPEQVQALKDHIQTYRSPSNDLRQPLRKIEQRLLNEYAGLLIGNQCMDFQKQDGITELEESIMANHVERNLNDLVLQDEQDGKISINRQPIYVSAVSNFTNFLDLFRKTIRCMELGIPCIVLGRSNTVQHSYRWTKLLMDLCKEDNDGVVDVGMITYLSCPVEDIVDITQSCQNYTGNLYSTCSRQLAETIKSGYPNTVASTGGPNTLVTTEWTDTVMTAIRMSATIESSGQCTALRHVVVPINIGEDDVVRMFNDTVAVSSAADAMKMGAFAGVFNNHRGSLPGPSEDGYKRHPTLDASYRVVKNNFPPNNIEEYWRKVVVDVSAIDIESNLQGLADWLNTNQPISLAVNGKTHKQSMDIGFWLWEHTGLVVNTIGSPDNPAMTCQARPQEGEVFGEFPPRRLLKRYTKFPVVVPSSTPGYDATYTNTYLEAQSKVRIGGKVGTFLDDLTDDMVKGFCVTLYEYLLDATMENPKRGFGTARTAVWGLQRPPLGTTTYIACNTSFDDIAPSLFLFYATNAKDQIVVVTESRDIKNLCTKHGIKTVDSIDKNSLSPGDNYEDVIRPVDTYPMVGHFVATLFPVGHIKSTMPNDDEFLAQVTTLQKWLRMS